MLYYQISKEVTVHPPPQVIKQDNNTAMAAVCDVEYYVGHFFVVLHVTY